MGGPRITMEVRRDVLKLRREHHTLQEIADMIGISRATVRTIAPRDNLTPYVGREPRVPVKPHIVDTRNYTQRFFGDPLPGRSALDRRAG